MPECTSTSPFRGRPVTGEMRILQPWLVYDRQADETEYATPTPQRVPEEHFRLTLAASQELAQFLQEHQVCLKKMAEEDERAQEKRREQAFSILFQARRRV